MSDGDNGSREARDADKTAGAFRSAGREAKKAADYVSQAARGTEAWRNHSSGLLGILNDFAGPLAIAINLSFAFASGLISVLRNSDLIGKSLQAWSRVQYYTPQFEKMLGGLTLAKDRLTQLMAISARGPFKFDDVAQANIRMQHLTKGIYSGSEAMEAIQDTAAQSGKSVTEVSEAVGGAMEAMLNHAPIDGYTDSMAQQNMITEVAANKLRFMAMAGASAASMMGALKDALAENKGAAANSLNTIDGLGKSIDNLKEKDLSGIGKMFEEGKLDGMRAGKALIEAYGPVLQQLLQPIAAIYRAWNALVMSFADFASIPAVTKAVRDLFIVLVAMATFFTGKALIMGFAALIPYITGAAVAFIEFATGARVAATGIRLIGLAFDAALGPIGWVILALSAVVALLDQVGAFKNMSLPEWVTHKKQKEEDDAFDKIQKRKEEVKRQQQEESLYSDTPEFQKRKAEVQAMLPSLYQKKRLQEAVGDTKGAEATESEIAKLNQSLSAKAILRDIENTSTADISKAKAMRVAGMAIGDKNAVFNADQMEMEAEKRKKEAYYISPEGGGFAKSEASRMATQDSLSDQINMLRSQGTVHASSMASVGGAMAEASGGTDQKLTTLIDLVRSINSGVEGGNSTSRQSAVSDQLNK